MRLSFRIQRSIYVPPGWKFSSSPFCPYSVFMCFVRIWEQTAIISLYSINWLVFITETEKVYCAVRTGSMCIIDITPSKLIGHYSLCTTRLNIQQFCILPTQWIYVFCMDLRKKNIDYFPVQHYRTGCYNWDGVCLVRGTDWIFIYNSS
jgi:hypothetical protein